MIIYLSGEDHFRSRQKLIELREAYLEKNNASGFFEFDALDREANMIDGIARALAEDGLFASKKLVIAKRFLGAPEAIRSQWLEFLEKHIESLETDSYRVLAIWEENAVKKTDKIGKLLEKHVAKKQIFEKLSGTRLEAWIAHRVVLHDAKTTIDREAIRMLASECSQDMYVLENMIRMLVDGCSNGNISAQDVRSIVSESVGGVVFDALDAIASGRQSDALRMFEERLDAGENEFYLLSMCAWQWKQFIRAKDAFEDGFKTAPLLAKELKMHPFAAGKVLRNLGRFSQERLLQGLDLLVRIDTDIKRGRMNAKTALSMAIMKL